MKKKINNVSTENLYHIIPTVDGKWYARSFEYELDATGDSAQEAITRLLERIYAK